METETIKYTINFLSDWHAGSGLSSGADADAVVIKDKNNLPYLPGKTVKGLLKDVLEDFMQVQPDMLQAAFIQKYFGAYNEDKKMSESGSLFFSNAYLLETEANEISSEMASFLYHNISATKIDGKTGTTEQSSLRTIEVCIPLALHGTIDGVATKDVAVFDKAFKYLRHLGSSRNRGLGRCSIQLNTK